MVLALVVTLIALPLAAFAIAPASDLSPPVGALSGPIVPVLGILALALVAAVFTVPHWTSRRVATITVCLRRVHLAAFHLTARGPKVISRYLSLA